jgi:uncharacterized protein (DUF2062 family)
MVFLSDVPIDGLPTPGGSGGFGGDATTALWIAAVIAFAFFGYMVFDYVIVRRRARRFQSRRHRTQPRA